MVGDLLGDIRSRTIGWGSRSMSGTWDRGTAGAFVEEEIHHVREGKHGARSTKQAIAIGLSKARRAGVDLPPSKGSSEETKEQAKRDLRKGRKGGAKKTSAKRSRG